MLHGMQQGTAVSTVYVLARLSALSMEPGESVPWTGCFPQYVHGFHSISIAFGSLIAKVMPRAAAEEFQPDRRFFQLSLFARSICSLRRR
jgi:hypothetical protein